MPGKKLNWSNQHMLIITSSSTYLILILDLKRVVKHMHGGDDRHPAGVVQTAQPQSSDRCPWRCTPVRDSAWNSYLCRCPSCPSRKPLHHLLPGLTFPLMVPQREAGGFSYVCLKVLEQLPFACVDAHFTEWL